jgi:hypothetical protein
MAIFKNNTKMEHSNSTNYKPRASSRAMIEQTNNMDCELAEII